MGGRFMSKIDYLIRDLIEFHASAIEFIGAFLYSPFGLETSTTVNTFTLYFIIGSLTYVTLRQNRDVFRELRGRRSNEFGLTRQRNR